MSTPEPVQLLDRLICAALDDQSHLHAMVATWQPHDAEWSMRVWPDTDNRNNSHILSDPLRPQQIGEAIDLFALWTPKVRRQAWARYEFVGPDHSLKRYFQGPMAQYVSFVHLADDRPVVSHTHIEREGPGIGGLELTRMSYALTDAPALEPTGSFERQTLTASEALALLNDPGFKQGTHRIVTHKPTLTAAGLVAQVRGQRALAFNRRAPLAF